MLKIGRPFCHFIKAIIQSSLILSLASLLLSCSLSKVAEDRHQELEEVIVHGIRASIPIDREYGSDESRALDIGALPDTALAESLLRSSKTQEAESMIWLPSNAQVNSQRIQIGDDEYLEPEELDFKVLIEGFRARVIVDALYFNSNNTVLEGNFKLRLPSGATPYYFAFGESIKIDLDAPSKVNKSQNALAFSPENITRDRSQQWSEPKVAVMAGREKAAFAYTKTVDRSVDPALLEWSGAGIFSASVFPLQSKSMHRVVIGYDINLANLGHSYFIDLPLAAPKQNKLKKSISIIGNEKESQTKISFVLDGKLGKPTSLNQELAITNRKLEGLRILKAQAADTYLVGEDDISAYFAINQQAILPNIQQASSERAIILLDTSLSADTQKFYLWRDYALAMLEANETRLKQFSMMSFNTNQNWFKGSWLPNNEQNRTLLKQYIDGLLLEGASDIQSALVEAAKKLHDQKASADIFLLSDGSATWGELSSETTIAKLQGQFSGKVFSVRLGTEGESRSYLDHLTERFSGSSFVISVPSDIEQLKTAHLKSKWTIIDINLDGATDILIEGAPTALYSGQNLVIAGRVTDKLGNRLTIKLKNGESQHLLTFLLTKKIPSSLTNGIYGQLALSHLASNFNIDRSLAEAYAKHYRIPGQYASLVMLESEDDYKEFKINPNQDKYLVSTSTIRGVVQQSSKDKIKPNRKNEILKLIERLKSIEELNYSENNRFLQVLKKSPESLFDLDVKSSKQATFLLKTQVPKEYTDSLKQEAPYKAIQTEALRRFDMDLKIDAITSLSSLVELDPGNTTVLRDISFTLEQKSQLVEAFELQERALNLRPYEPNSYLALANLATKMKKPTLAAIYYELIDSVNWHESYGDIKLIARTFYMRLLEDINSGVYGNDLPLYIYAGFRLAELNQQEHAPNKGILIYAEWNTDRTDVDLHIREPNREECSYENVKTKSGGILSEDVTEGFGPELYFHSKPLFGKYGVWVEYFSDDENKLGVTTRVKITSITNAGTRKEKRREQIVTLDTTKKKQDIKSIYYRR